MARKAKATAPALQVPQNDEDANVILHAYGQGQLLLDRLQAKLDAEVAAAKQRAENIAKPVQNEMATQLQQLSAWAAANRNRLTQDNKVKTVDLPAGKVGWRTKPPSVKLTGSVEAVLFALKNLGMHRFIRRKEEVNKERLLEDRAQLKGCAIPGVRIDEGKEAFYVEPAGLDLAKPAP